MEGKGAVFKCNEVGVESVFYLRFGATTKSPPYPQFHSPGFQLPTIHPCQEEDDPFSDESSEEQQ